jgi:hypothetical protein
MYKCNNNDNCENNVCCTCCEHFADCLEINTACELAVTDCPYREEE